jgi:diadenosine tetraphosphate (Ap4A) HIT family hydrolase
MPLPFFNRSLCETPHFHIFPALGCLAVGYVMVVSKRHVNSMCHLTDVEKRDLETLLEKYRDILKKIYGLYPIVFEHGSSSAETDNSASTIRHAHMHVVPVKLREQNDMLEFLELNKLTNYSEFYESVHDNPYLFFMDNEHNIYLHNITDIAPRKPSQLIRRWVAKEVGHAERWDWREYPFEDNIVATIKRHRLQRVYYCRAMDGLNRGKIKAEYDNVKQRLANIWCSKE